MNQAKQHWNSVSSTCQLQILSNHKEHLQLLCTMGELWAPAFVGLDEMGEVVDYIDSMCD
jgi:hypothetical protein